MYRKQIPSVSTGIVCGVLCAMFVDLSSSQTPNESGTVEAYRVNALQKFIVANTYLFADSSKLSYLYAYDPHRLESAHIVEALDTRVLEPSGKETKWWAEDSYQVIDFDSYPVCAEGKTKLTCLHDGAFLATKEKHPDIKYDHLFVIKGLPAETSTDIN